MRKSLPLSLVAALALSACGGESAPSPSAAPSAPGAAAPAPAAVPAQPAAVSGPAISASLSIKDAPQMQPGINLHLKLVDVTDAAAVPVVVAESTQPAPTMPAQVQLGYDPANIDQARVYALQASLQAETFVLYGTPAPTPVLTQGAPSSGLALELVRGGQPSADVPPNEKLKNDFAKLEAEIGGLRRIQGERLEADIAVGWDAFVDSSGQIRMAREQVDYGDAGQAEFRYAYVGGQPWVVERKQGGATTLVGWNSEGQIVVNEKGDAPAADDEVETLKKRAADLYTTAAAKR